MTREEKSQVIAALKEELAAYNVIYLADISNLNAAATEKLRRACFNAGIRLEVVKNTLLAKAMEASEKDFQGLTEILKGNTALMLTEGAANVPGKLIKDFRKTSERPVLNGLLQSPIRRVISALENKGEGAPEAKAEAPAEQAAPQEEAPAAE